MTTPAAQAQRSITRAEQLNAGCQCVSLDQSRLRDELERVSPGFYEAVLVDRPNLFAASMVFVGEAHLRRMADLVTAIDQVIALPAYQAQVLQWAPETARHDPGTPGVFLGYDFHVGEREQEVDPQLIEINTNAGGGLLMAMLTRAQKACCADVSTLLPGGLAEAGAEAQFVDMFRREWAAWQVARCRPIATEFSPSPLQRVAIVDDAPQAQFLHPEFVLFQRLFMAAGIEAVVADPAELRLADGRLWHGGLPIDLVYNRLTDFSFDEPAHAALRAAYLSDAALVTPHPRAHALYADKRNLVVLTDDDQLRDWGVEATTRAVLRQMIPRTERVDPADAEALWARRRTLFFKPAAGFGSRAAYRGDKLTRRVFDEILAGNYIAQALVPPSQRTLNVGGEKQALKLDLRNYVYGGQVQLVAARLWQGQTTNFRTPGGGFAAVLSVPGTEISA